MPDLQKYFASTCHAFVVGAVLFLPVMARAGDIDAQKFDQIERGRYLAILGDCTGCHTLPGSRRDFAGGRPLETPFGVLLGPNITPDRETGIGAWTDDEFVNALKNGTGRGGTHLFPAMPYTYYSKITRDDALAIRAYLNTVPAVHNTVSPDQLPFPFNVRASLAVWNKLFFTPEEFQPNRSKSPEWNRGAYLTEGLGHCGMCHTPKNALGGDDTSERMQGYNLQGWFAPNITNDTRIGLGSWSVDDIAAYLKTGHNQTSAATGIMAEEIGLSTSKVSDGDLKAIATYLKDRPGDSSNQNNRAQATSSPPDQGVMKIGAQIYADECSGCHGANGKGVSGLFPSLNGAPVVRQKDATSIVHVVLRGAISAGTKFAPTAAAMPAFAWVMNDDQVAAVATYIRNSWGNAAPAVNGGDVAKERAALAERSD
ncbi:MAG: cytochrome c [Xanthobacteraceae bacterium]|jgi:mono/diheme cytochrome c family protein